MSTVTKDQVIAYLVQCPPGEFIQILAPALQAHRDGGAVERRLAVCQLTRADDPPKGECAWTDLEIIAAAPSIETLTHRETGWYWESGLCEHCRVEVLSYAKTAICPLCDSTVHLT